MIGERAFDPTEDLHWTAALSWAADCVEHLAERVGDTPANEIAACVAVARTYAQTRQFDASEARKLASSVRSARWRMALPRKGSVAVLVAFVVIGALLPGGGGNAGGTDVFGSTGGSGDSEFVRRERKLKAQRKALLRAAESLCTVDARAAAREAPVRCRRAQPSEGTWQFDRLLAYIELARSNSAGTGTHRSSDGTLPA
jgi:hypothetical protein